LNQQILSFFPELIFLINLFFNDFTGIFFIQLKNLPVIFSLEIINIFV